MVVAIALAGLSLKRGLANRNARRKRALRTREMRAAHLRVAKPAVVLILVGFVAGPASAAWLRGWGVFESLHGWIGITGALLFMATGFYGRRLERGNAGATETHAVLGLLSVLAAAMAAVAGFALLA